MIQIASSYNLTNFWQCWKLCGNFANLHQAWYLCVSWFMSFYFRKLCTTSKTIYCTVANGKLVWKPTLNWPSSFAISCGIALKCNRVWNQLWDHLRSPIESVDQFGQHYLRKFPNPWGHGTSSQLAHHNPRALLMKNWIDKIKGYIPYATTPTYYWLLGRGERRNMIIQGSIQVTASGFRGQFVCDWDLEQLSFSRQKLQRGRLMKSPKL